MDLVRTDLEAARQAAHRLAHLFQDVGPHLVDDTPAGRHLVLEGQAKLLLEQLRLAINHGGLMAAYARGVQARDAFFAKHRDPWPSPPEAMSLWSPRLAEAAERVEQSIAEVLTFDDFGPISGAPKRPGPAATARYARAHLETLAHRFPASMAELMEAGAVRRKFSLRGRLDLPS